jgi:prepilin-type N-terminal cleavage/methylation domain-containing protein
VTSLDSSQGFSLTELLIAITVLLIGVGGLVSGLTATSQQLRFGLQDTQVALLMADQLERLRSRGYSELEAGVRVDGPYRLSWEPAASDSTRVILVATYAGRGESERRDTLVADIGRP